MRVFTCMAVTAWPEHATDCPPALSNRVSAGLDSNTCMRHVWVQEERARALQLREEGKIPPTLEPWSDFVEAATGHRSCAPLTLAQPLVPASALNGLMSDRRAPVCADARATFHLWS